eukprot:2451510-Amphidinium_carterae.2
MTTLDGLRVASPPEFRMTTWDGLPSPPKIRMTTWDGLPSPPKKRMTTWDGLDRWRLWARTTSMGLMSFILIPHPKRKHPTPHKPPSQSPQHVFPQPEGYPRPSPPTQHAQDGMLGHTRWMEAMG